MTEPAWAVPVPEVVECDHASEDGRYLCGGCVDQLERCLADVPYLLEHLDVALTKQVRFVEQPTIGSPDEAPVVFHVGASNARRRLMAALRAPFGVDLDGEALSRVWLCALDSGELLRREGVTGWVRAVTAAVVQAHRVIDRPADRQYLGACPACGADLSIERGDLMVSCGCGWSCSTDEYARAALERVDDLLMSESQILGAVLFRGEPLGRPRLLSWIRSNKLAVHELSQPVWREGRIVSVTVRRYRLGDVRVLAAQKEGREFAG